MQLAAGADPAEATKPPPRVTNDSARRNVHFIRESRSGRLHTAARPRRPIAQGIPRENPRPT